MDWFLYDKDLRHERVKNFIPISNDLKELGSTCKLCIIPRVAAAMILSINWLPLGLNRSRISARTLPKLKYGRRIFGEILSEEKFIRIFGRKMLTGISCNFYC